MTHVLMAVEHAPRVVWELAALVFAGWRIDMEVHPFARCRRCKGSGLNRGSGPDRFGLCAHGQRRVRFTGRRAAQRHLRRRGM